MTPPTTPATWYSQEIDQVLSSLESDRSKGLTQAEAEKRLREKGKNSITPKKQQSAFIRFLLQFHQPLVYILLAASITTLFLKEYIDAGVIFAVVLVNSISRLYTGVESDKSH